MAIYHCSMKVIARSKGRSAVAAAAYRSASIIENKRDGIVHDFTKKHGVLHAEIILPQGVKAEWAYNRSALWNAAEFAEKRSDGRVAREFEIALPHELTREQQVILVKEFSQHLANRFETGIDFAIHAPDAESDMRNVHAHVLMTTRKITSDGLGEKTHIERENKWLLERNLPPTQLQLREVRLLWEQSANMHLARAGHSNRIDHRSHIERGLEVEPTMHMGVHATQMQRRGMAVDRLRLEAQARERNAALIREKPEQLLSLITSEKSVFDRYDIARALHRYINDDPLEYQNIFSAVMASPVLVKLQPEDDRKEARYSTREMMEIEAKLIRDAERMVQRSSYPVEKRYLTEAFNPSHGINLSAEQKAAVEHVTGQRQLTAVVGLAGAGKSTMLSVARQAFEAKGYRVHGAALSGKAAEGLEEASGIASRTLASWEYSWQAGRSHLSKGDVLVIDEAGMLSSHQLGRFLSYAWECGAKVVLVGDHEQLQAIGAGAPFRLIADRVGAAELQEIRRQRQEWQRQATFAFATYRVKEALSEYNTRELVQMTVSRENARLAIVDDYVKDHEAFSGASQLVLAHRREDVRGLNEQIRGALLEKSLLSLQDEMSFETRNGVRSFSSGDRIVFLENDRDLGVKNGMLGTVRVARKDHLLVHLDGRKEELVVPIERYRAFDHGYATTIHKSQGATVDRVYVLASSSMDRHLTYVAMSRHRDHVKLYAGQDEFRRFEDLTTALSRSGAKEMTLDYTVEAMQQQKSLASVFPSDFRQHNRQEPLGSSSRSVSSVERYARALIAIEEMERSQLPILEAQKQELSEAGQQLDRFFAGKGVALLQSARRYNIEVDGILRNMSGRDRGWQLLDALERESLLQADPKVRADRFISEWKGLQQERRKLHGWSHKQQREQLEKQMQEIAQAITQDTPAAKIVTERSHEFGVSSIRPNEQLTHALNRQIERGRGIGLEL